MLDAITGIILLFLNVISSFYNLPKDKIKVSIYIWSTICNNLQFHVKKITSNLNLTE